MQLEQAQSQLIAARQDVLLRSLSAHVNVRRALEVLNFAKQSEENIKAQAVLENALVERGAGLSTDVLQAKVTLRVPKRGGCSLKVLSKLHGTHTRRCFPSS